MDECSYQLWLLYICSWGLLSSHATFPFEWSTNFNSRHLYIASILVGENLIVPRKFLYSFLKVLRDMVLLHSYFDEHVCSLLQAKTSAFAMDLQVQLETIISLQVLVGERQNTCQGRDHQTLSSKSVKPNITCILSCLVKPKSFMQTGQAY